MDGPRCKRLEGFLFGEGKMLWEKKGVHFGKEDLLRGEEVSLSLIPNWEDGTIFASGRVFQIKASFRRSHESRGEKREVGNGKGE